MSDAASSTPATVPAKPRVRVMARTTATADSFQNFVAGLGQGAQNLVTGGTYGFNPVTRIRTRLEYAYRGNWLVGRAVDIPAEDMTRAGIDIQSADHPKEAEKVHAAMRDLQVWQSLQDGIRWGRLFGGAICVMLIDGQKLETPLKLDTIGKDSFKGLAVMDRWMVTPTVNDLVSDLGPDMGKPKFYQVTSGPGSALNGLNIHYSRVLRFEGFPLPYWQKWSEMLWGESVIERLYDRLVNYDSMTAGIAQLVFKASLRTLSVPELRNIIAAGGPAMAGLLQQVAMMRNTQSNEGITIIDGDDEFTATNYTFAGLSDVAENFASQLAGAMEVPVTRLFGQSPGGMNSTGESDQRNYEDGNHKKQERDLRRPVTVLLDVLYRSVNGAEPPDGFTFTFNPISQLSEADKADVVDKRTTSALAAFTAGVTSAKTTLMELRALGPTTGAWTNITDEDIAAADDEPPEPVSETVGEASEGTEPGDTTAPKVRDTAAADA